MEASLHSPGCHQGLPLVRLVQPWKADKGNQGTRHGGLLVSLIAPLRKLRSRPKVRAIALGQIRSGCKVGDHHG